MINRSHKKWIILALAVVIIGGFVLIKGISRQKVDEPGGTDFRRPPGTGSFSDFNLREKAYLDSIKDDPENADAHAVLGDLYFENKRYQQAVDQYNKVLSLNDKDVDTYNDLGLSLFFLGQSDRAVETLRRGTTVNPSYQRIWLSLGFILANRGSKKEALVALEKAAAIDPGTDVGQEATSMIGKLKDQQ